MKDVYKFCFLLKSSCVLFVYLHCLQAGNQWSMITRNQPPFPWGFERVKVGGLKRGVEVADVFGKKWCFPFLFVQNVGYLKENTDVFVDDFWGCVFFFKTLCCLYLFCLVGILCTFTMLVMAVWEAQLWENEGLIEGYQTICWASILFGHYSQIWKGPNSTEVVVLLHNPIGSMGLVYLPAFTINLNQM